MRLRRGALEELDGTDCHGRHLGKTLRKSLRPAQQKKRLERLSSELHFERSRIT